MARTCSKCGWKHKPSQEKYYKSRGLSKPICEDCNPSLQQKIIKLRKKALVSFFSDGHQGLTFACVPYFIVLFSLTLGIAALFTQLTKDIPYISNNYFLIVIISIIFFGGMILNTEISQKVGDKIAQKYRRNQSVTLIVILYYTPLLFIIVLGLILFNW